MKATDPLRRAISLIGREKIAELTGVTAPESVSRWHQRGVPARHCLTIQEATDGLVTAYDLRPDIFPKPNSSQSVRA